MKEKLNNVIEFNQESKKKKKYFLVVSDEQLVLECWANSYLDLMGITTIYDENENPKKVSMIIDVAERHIYETNINTSFASWIPVIERLPKVGTSVLACLDDGFITGVDFQENGEWGLWADSGDVVAWMPLPEPYNV